MGEIFMIMIAAVLTENIIFSKLIGASPFLGFSEKPAAALKVGGAVAVAMSASSLAAWLVYSFILAPLGLEYLVTFALVIIIAGLALCMDALIKNYFPEFYQEQGILLPLLTANSAVMGVALIIIDREYNLIRVLAYGASAAVGFTLAIIIFAGVRARINFANPPEAFKGVPIALVAAGLLAMAFAGFWGLEIPFLITA